MLKRWLLRGAILLVAAELALCAAAYWAMRQTPDKFGRIVAASPMALMMGVPFETLWTSARGGNLHPGDPAPDFTLPLLDRSAKVQLSSLRGNRPVVLVFGSYT
jgi:hypothetical protein